MPSTLTRTADVHLALHGAVSCCYRLVCYLIAFHPPPRSVAGVQLGPAGWDGSHLMLPKACFAFVFAHVSWWGGLICHIREAAKAGRHMVKVGQENGLLVSLAVVIFRCIS